MAGNFARPPEDQLLLEFFGPPGGGKSTVSRLIVDTYRSAGREVLSIDDQLEIRTLRGPGGGISVAKAWALIRYAFTHLHVSRAILACVHHSGWSISRIKRGAVLLRAFQTNSECLAAAKSLVVRDEGVIQAIWGLALNGRMPPVAVLRRLIAAAFDRRRSVSVFVDVPASKSFERIRARSAAGRLDRLDDATLAEWLRSNLDRFYRLVDCIESEGIRVIRLDGTADVRQSSESLMEQFGGAHVAR